jgi:hypothetical protein
MRVFTSLIRVFNWLFWLIAIPPSAAMMLPTVTIVPMIAHVSFVTAPTLLLSSYPRNRA